MLKNKIFKNLIAIVLAITLIFSLSGCGSDTSSDSKNSTSSSDDITAYEFLKIISEVYFEDETSDSHFDGKIESTAFDFVQQHDEMFTAYKTDADTRYKSCQEFYDSSINYKSIKKNPEKTANGIMLLTNAYVIDIVERSCNDAKDTYFTMAYLYDDNEDATYIVFYLDTCDVYEEDLVSTALLPIAYVEEDDENCIFGLASMIGSDLDAQNINGISLGQAESEDSVDMNSSEQNVVSGGLDEQNLMTDSMMLMFELQPDFSTSEFSFSHNGTDAEGKYSIFATDYDEETYLKIYPEIGLIYYSVTDVNDGEHSEVILMENFEYTGAW